MNRSDRSSVNQLSRVANGVGNHRDASGSGAGGANSASGSGPWKANPTLIELPMSRNHRTQAIPNTMKPHHHTQSKTSLMNPLTRIGKERNAGPPKPSPFNPTSSQRPSRYIAEHLPRSSKRQKTGDGVSSRYFNDNTGSASSRDTRASRRAAEVIELDDSEKEDVGEPLARQPSSPDALNLLGQSSTSPLPIEREHPHPFQTEDDSSRTLLPSGSKHRARVRDGEATSKLRRAFPTKPPSKAASVPIAPIDVDESDPICSYGGDEHPPWEPAKSELEKGKERAGSQGLGSIAPGTVRNRASMYEDPHARPVVRAVEKPRPGGVKAGMKGKNLPKEPGGGSVNDVLMRSSNFHSSVPANSAPPKKASKQLNTLTLDAVCLGGRLLEPQGDTRMYCQFNPVNKQVTIKESKFLGSRPMPLSFDLERAVMGAVLSDKPHHGLIQFHIAKGELKKLDNSYFEGGSKWHNGMITLRCSATSPEQQKIYEELIGFITRAVDKKEIITGRKPVESCWQMAVHATELTGQRDTRRASTQSASSAGPNARVQRVEDMRNGPSNGTGRAAAPVKRKASRTLSNCSDSSDGLPPGVLDMSSVAGRPRPRPIPRASSRPASRQSDVDDFDIPEPPRRSNRNSTRSSRRGSPAPDPDELVLTYPLSGKGAVNITRGDLNRLDPGEFLNDTLIEFGLKLWHAELREKNAELADQIHVFSSFFYKKLNQRKLEDGFQSIKKWTQKIDIFQKKYLIVPINEHMHWYLAIVYMPERALQPPPLKPLPVSATTRNRAKDRASGRHEHVGSPLRDITDDNIPAQRVASPMEVEGMLNACSLTTGSDDGSVNTDKPRSIEGNVDDSPATDQRTSSTKSSSSPSPKPVDAMDQDETDDTAPSRHSPTLTYGERTPEREVDIINDQALEYVSASRPASPSTDGPNGTSMVEATGDGITFGPRPDNTEPAEIDVVEVQSAPESVSTRAGISPRTFYASMTGKDKGKGKAEPFPVDVDGDDQQAGDDSFLFSEAANDGHPVPYIFTLDSLNSRHPQAIKILRNYLKMEAADKKQLSDTTEAVGKQAQVPVQPNYCDCGPYLLHFVKTFIDDPEYFAQVIIHPKSASKHSDRKTIWKDAEVEAARGTLLRRAEELSVIWKAEREKKRLEDEAAGVGKVDAVVESDDDVVIEEVQPAAPAKGRRSGAGAGAGAGPASGEKQTPAARIRG